MQKSDKLFDDFKNNPKQRPHIVVLVENVVLETSQDDLLKEFSRGFYTFSSQKAQKGFTRACNSDRDNPVAYMFTKHYKETERNEND